MTTIAVLVPGAMGSGIGLRLVEGGARVLTSLEGRGEATRRRSMEAGIADASLDAIAEAELILSIVPPGAALSMAERLAPVLRRSRVKPVFVDANAISPVTMARVAAALDGTGCPLVDGCIIGGPPKPQGKSPAFYVSGDPEGLTAPLGRHGLDLRVLDAPLGAASGLKMSYAMCTKGVTALGAAMLLGAAREGIGPALHDELVRSQSDMLARFGKAMPDMLPKAYRWVAEMREIAAFLGPDDPAALMFEGAARIYERLAADQAGSGALSEELLGAVRH